MSQERYSPVAGRLGAFTSALRRLLPLAIAESWLFDGSKAILCFFVLAATVNDWVSLCCLRACLAVAAMSRCPVKRTCLAAEAVLELAGHSTTQR